MEERSCTVTVIGDGMVGKTCLLMRYVNNKAPAPNEYVPTVFENHSQIVDFDGMKINLKLYDTAGQEEYAKVRALAYDRTDVFLLCYDLTELNSLQNCKSVWAKEVRALTKAPIILVGTKADLVEQVGLSNRTGLSLAKKIKAHGFFMVSSLTGTNVEEVVMEAIRASLKTKSNKCNII